MMTTPENPSPPGYPAPRPRRWRRRLLIALVVVAGVVGLLAGLLFAAPRYIARYVTNQYLQGIEVDVEGVKTLDIDLPKGKLSFGPVRFRDMAAGPESDLTAGQVGRLSVQVNLRNLLDKKALIQQAAIEGVEIIIAQGADGEISINGIPLRRLLAEQAEKTEEPPPARGDPSWGTGFDEFTLREFNLTFQDTTGERLTLGVERLDLVGFRSWEPDSPGTFTLLANINGIPVIAWGQLEPFAQTIRGRIELSAKEIELPKIETYTGPLDLISRAGVGTLDIRGRFTLTPDSRIDAFATGRVALSGVDVASESGGITSATGRIELSAELQRDGTGGIEATANGSVDLHDTTLRAADGGSVAIGGGSLTIEGFQLRAPTDAASEITALPRLVLTDGKLVAAGEGPRIAFGETRLAIGDLNVKQQPDGRIAITGRPQIDITEPSLSGPAEAGAAAISLAVPALSVETGDDGTQVSGGASLSLADARVRMAGAANAGASDAALASAVLGLEDVAVRITAERTEVSGASDLAVTNVAFKQGGGVDGSAPASTDAGVEKLEVSVRPLRLVLAGDTLSSEFSATGRVEKPRGLVQSGQRIDAAADTLTLGLKDAAITGRQAGLDAIGQLQSELTALAVSLAPGPGTGAVPSAATRVAVGSVTLGASPLDAKIDGRGTRLNGDASVQLKQLDLNLAASEGGPMTVALSNLRLGVAKLAGVFGDAETTLNAGVQLAADGARADLALLGKGARASLDGLQLSFSPVSLAAQAGTWRLSSAGSLDLRKLASALPQVGGHAMTAEIGALQVSLDEATAASGKAAPVWQTRLDLTLSALEASLDQDRFASAKVERVNLRNLRADQALDINADTLAVTKLRANLTLPKAPETPRAQAAATPSAPSPAPQAPAEPSADGGETARLRLHQFGIIDGAILRVSDPNVNPPLAATIDVRKLNLLNVDTARSQDRTDIDLDARINDSAQLTLSGWSSALGAKSDFAMTGRIQDLQLPAFSSLVAGAVGVNIESGRLGAELAAKAAAGKLDGLIDLSIANLSLGGLDERQKQQLTAKVGMPIGTAVELLKDQSGTINLKLPIAGDLTSPAFDPSDAIAQAVGGALQAAALAPFRLAFAPVSLLAGAIDASGLPKLTPIPVAAGSAKLDPQADGMIRALASVLKERPALALKVCGRATSADFEALMATDQALAKLPADQRSAKAMPQLQQLADERTRAVRSAVIAAGALDNARVGECRAIADPTDATPPRAEITF